MARSRRLIVPNCAYHILHRGYARDPVFLSEDDFRYYVENLRELKELLNCKVYAYCLMLNHVHLLVEVGDDPSSLGGLMKHLAGRQARYRNGKEGSSGAVWEGRFRSSPVAPSSEKGSGVFS